MKDSYRVRTDDEIRGSSNSSWPLFFWSSVTVGLQLIGIPLRRSEKWLMWLHASLAIWCSNQALLLICHFLSAQSKPTIQENENNSKMM